MAVHAGVSARFRLWNCSGFRLPQLLVNHSTFQKRTISLKEGLLGDSALFPYSLMGASSYIRGICSGTYLSSCGAANVELFIPNKNWLFWGTAISMLQGLCSMVLSISVLALLSCIPSFKACRLFRAPLLTSGCILRDGQGKSAVSSPELHEIVDRKSSQKSVQFPPSLTLHPSHVKLRVSGRRAGAESLPLRRGHLTYPNLFVTGRDM